MKNLPLDTILHGSCLEVIRQLPEKSIDMVFADPPYNLQLSRELRRPNHTRVSGVNDDWDKFTSFEEYDNFTCFWLSSCRRILKDEGTLWVIGTYHNIFRVGAILQDLGYWILNDVVWLKTNPMPNFRGVRFTNAHETLIWAQKIKGKKYTFNHNAMKSLNGDLQMRSDWSIPLCTGKERLRSDGSKTHSTQKPESLLYRIILSSSNYGDVVLDPFFGSGTTGAVARKLGRHFIGIELEETYIKVASDRIAAVEPANIPSLTLQEPRQRIRIPFGTLLETGLLQPGQKLFPANNKSVSATVLSNGKLQMGNLLGTIHTLAKTLSEDKPINGWEFWLYAVDENKYPIDNLRQILQTEKESHFETNPNQSKD
jgi:modification methylase